MGKRVNPVKLLLDDRELLDLSRAANDDSRCVSDMVHVIVRRYLYGRLGGRPLDLDVQSLRGAEQCLGGTAGAPDFCETRGGAL